MPILSRESLPFLDPAWGELSETLRRLEDETEALLEESLATLSEFEALLEERR